MEHVTRRMLEREMGREVPDDIFRKALSRAERKQLYIFQQERKPYVLADWYLLTLTAEKVQEIEFENYTLEQCEKKSPLVNQGTPGQSHCTVF